ncbi:MAG: hypothetical protein ACTTKD_07410 [Peptoanaerobacter stomatis]|uniref:hypothetical protein n=1 Tax=Peptoanaerobacter stomatis TaxID=796937 RepID=UPI003FA08435
MNNIDITKHFEKENKTEIIKTFDNGDTIEIRRLSLQEMAQMEYEITNVLVDNMNKQYHTNLYNYIIDTRILKYFAGIDFENIDMLEMYDIYMTNEIQSLIKDIKTSTLVASQIQALYTSFVYKH